MNNCFQFHFGLIKRDQVPNINWPKSIFPKQEKGGQERREKKKSREITDAASSEISNNR